MAPDKRRPYDDGDSFVALRQKRTSNRALLLVGLIVGGAVLPTTCACGLGIALFVFAYQAKQPEGSQPEEFIGSWKGRFLLHGEQRDVVYIFEKSGKWSEVDFTPDGRRVSRSSGRWAFQNGRITINFNGGTSETANAVFTDINTIDYLIVRHDDETQIGLRTTFRRQ